MKNKNIDLQKVIDIFNAEGKRAAAEFTEVEYNAQYTTVQRKIKEETNYIFNRTTRKYEIRDKEATFMTLEELCKDKPKTARKINEDRSSFGLNPHLNENIFKDLIVNLMKDKMQEMSKYIYLEQSTKLVLISLKKLEESGYKVVLD